MANGLATKGAFSRRQCAVGPCGVCKLERLKATMVPNAKLRGGAGRTQKLEKDIDNVWL